MVRFVLALIVFLAAVAVVADEPVEKTEPTPVEQADQPTGPAPDAKTSIVLVIDGQASTVISGDWRHIRDVVVALSLAVDGLRYRFAVASQATTVDNTKDTEGGGADVPEATSPPALKQDKPEGPVLPVLPGPVGG